MDEPVTETYPVLASDPEIQTLHVCLTALQRHLRDDPEARSRVAKWLVARAEGEG